MKATHAGYAGYHTAKQTMSNLKSYILYMGVEFPTFEKRIKNCGSRIRGENAE